MLKLQENYTELIHINIVTIHIVVRNRFHREWLRIDYYVRGAK